MAFLQKLNKFKLDEIMSKFIFVKRLLHCLTLGNQAVFYIFSYFHIFNIILGTLYSGYVMFCWIYGVCNGGYAYTLKMYIYEKVRARNFARAWSFTQMAMGLALVIGLPLSSVVKRVREQVYCLIAFWYYIGKD